MECARHIEQALCYTAYVLVLGVSVCYDTVQENTTTGVVTYNFTADTLLFQQMQANVTQCFNDSDTVSMVDFIFLLFSHLFFMLLYIRRSLWGTGGTRYLGIARPCAPTCKD